MTTGPVTFPLGPFTPHDKNPIMSPQGDTWESGSVYNPAAIVVEDKVALLYRAHADDIISHVGLAWSTDGFTFEREAEPVLSPSEEYDRFGCEDPRVTEIDGTYYLTYTGWDREHALLCLATSTDLRQWTKHGPLFPDFDTFQPQGNDRPGPWSKAGGILPVQVDGKWLMYFGEGSIWLATSTDLLHWTPVTPDSEPPIMAPRRGTFSDFLVEVGPQPLVTDDGLILLVHNAATKNADGTVRYTAGQLLIDPARPTEILAELTRPWIEPTTYEDTHGLVSNVTFVEGLVFFQDSWFAYYGQSDSTLAVATFTPGKDRWSEVRVP
ncbi:glycosylase [Calidifontibacter sp. DB0510]|uniref:Glycosylase n=1 Tax=Metallococcus carri TaxID=1656884 RepID=A0A967B7E7_9MICO|nr:glycoside hydrolase family 130 protein [Metallococcus carri]NHN56952.1 glycosylase [Metallococcus carri]NOP37697.1 glycosylase [Calidifontibacter sp. DB2511S]